MENDKLTASAVLKSYLSQCIYTRRMEDFEWLPDFFSGVMGMGAKHFDIDFVAYFHVLRCFFFSA